MRWCREFPRSLTPDPVGKDALVATNTWSLRPAMAFPRTSSDSPFEYTSAVSNRLMPDSRQTSTKRVASGTSVVPQARKNSVPPPNVAVPKLRTGTFRPEYPSCRYSIAVCDDSLLTEVSLVDQVRLE